MMSRIGFSVILTGALLCVSQGCAHFFVSRSIEKFTRALENEDLDGLKSNSSTKFKKKALRLDESLDDIRILNLPEGKISIVKVDDVSEDEKRVTVTAGKSKRNIRYKLTRERDSKKWVVDDIYITQKRKGLKSTKSVTEQMDLLLTVRELLAAWTQGGRDDVLGVTTAEFGQRLGELPPAYLARLTRQVAGEQAQNSRHSPEAQMDHNVAIVRLERTTGEMVISFRLQNGVWKVDDIAVESKADEEHIPSVRKMAQVISTAVSFLDAFEADDKQVLANVCTKKLQEVLMPADLSSVMLPSADGPNENYHVKSHGDHASFVIPGETHLVKVSLTREEKPDQPSRYLVEEVTIYELDGKQEKRLSALFTARAMMYLFSDSLAHRDLLMLRRIATPDFSSRIWKKVDEQSIRWLPLAEFENVTPEISAIVFRGAITEITVKQGSRTLKYMLRSWNGKLRVDDVLVSVSGRPESLKQTLELMMPVFDFAKGIDRAQVDLLQRTSSNDFNRVVWNQVRRFPTVGAAVVHRLQSPLKSVELEPDRATLKLGTESWGAHVHLVREHEHWVIDDVLVISGLEPAQRRPLKQALRVELANGFSNARRLLGR